MIVSSSANSLKKSDNAFNSLLLRTDGFKHVFRGLTYKQQPSRQQNTHAGTYTSIGRRTPAKEYHLTKDGDSKLECEEASRQGRRTQTAEMAQRKRTAPIDNREALFLKAEREETECFNRFMEKLGI